MPGFLRRLYGPVVVGEEFPTPRPDVFSVLTDPETYPEWLVGADRIREVDPEFPEPGAQFDHSVGAGGPLTVDDHTESVATEEDRRLRLLVHAGPLHAVAEFTLSDLPGGGTWVSLSERPVGMAAALTPVLRPMLGARNRRSLTQLRAFVVKR